MAVDWLLLTGALLSGLLGSVHCIAMCGGIAVGLSSGVDRGNAAAAAWRLNLGRIAGYSLAGDAVGGLGAGLLSIARSEPLQWTLRAMVGAILIVAALRILWPRLSWVRPAVESRVWSLMQPWLRGLLPARTATRQLIAGALWGWLPCGLSMTLLSAAWLTASAREGALVMATFGLGTAVTMVPLTWSGQRIGFWLQRPRMRRAGGWVLMACGVLTLSAPALAQHPAAHAILSALGCQSLI